MKGTNRKIFRIYGTTVPRRTLRSLGSCSRNRLTYSQARTFCAAPAEVIIKTPAKRKRGRLPSNKLLLLIALYKFFQAAIIALIGFGAMRLLHKDFGDVMLQVASALRFNPESRFVNFVLDRASVVDDHLLRRIGVVAFCYAGLSLAEGIGLYLEKTWGELLTLLITASFLPWEVFEVFKRVTWIRIALLIVNALVFLYLLKVVAQRKSRT